MTKRDRWGDEFEKASEEVSDWRQKHPRASLTDIENSVDEELAKVRAKMIAELAQESPLTDLTKMKSAERPKCPGCGRPIVANGRQKRKLITKREQEIELERSKGYCRDCRVSFFPPG